MQPEAYRGHCTPMKTSPQSLPSPHPSSPKLLLSCFLLLSRCVSDEHSPISLAFQLAVPRLFLIVLACSSVLWCRSKGHGEWWASESKTPFLAGPWVLAGLHFDWTREIRWHHGQSSRGATIPSPSVASNPVELLEALSDHWLWGHRLLGWLCLLTGQRLHGAQGRDQAAGKGRALVDSLAGPPSA